MDILIIVLLVIVVLAPIIADIGADTTAPPTSIVPSVSGGHVRPVPLITIPTIRPWADAPGLALAPLPHPSEAPVPAAVASVAVVPTARAALAVAGPSVVAVAPLGADVPLEAVVAAPSAAVEAADDADHTHTAARDFYSCSRFL